jgi:hypothetical protein
MVFETLHWQIRFHQIANHFHGNLQDKKHIDIWR